MQDFASAYSSLSTESGSDSFGISRELIRTSTSLRDASFGSTALRPSLQASYLAWVFLRLLLTLHCAEEVLQFLEGFLGTFFLEKMAAIEAATGNR